MLRVRTSRRSGGLLLVGRLLTLMLVLCRPSATCVLFGTQSSVASLTSANESFDACLPFLDELANNRTFPPLKTA